MAVQMDRAGTKMPKKNFHEMVLVPKRVAARSVAAG
jgi:hypothetical protein